MTDHLTVTCKVGSHRSARFQGLFVMPVLPFLCLHPQCARASCQPALFSLIQSHLPLQPPQVLLSVNHTCQLSASAYHNNDSTLFVQAARITATLCSCSTIRCYCCCCYRRSAQVWKLRCAAVIPPNPQPLPTNRLAVIFLTLPSNCGSYAG
jgi:hypothetical protein